MLNREKHLSGLVILAFSLLFIPDCSRKSPDPSVYKNPEGSPRVTIAYEAVLKRWPVPCERRFLSTSFGATHVVTWGNRKNPPLLLFHGGGNCALMWIFIAKQLAVGHYVIAPDTVGDMGLSVPARPFLRASDYAAWFTELADGLGLRRVDIAGLSWGGGIALQAALLCPGRVNRIVLLSPAWGLEIFRIDALLYHSLPAVFFPGPERVRNLLGWLSVKRPVFADPRGDAIVDYLVVALKNYTSPKTADPVIFSDAQLRGIGVPVCLMIGDGEVIYADPDRVIRRASENIPDIRVKVIPGAGHALIYDRPEEVAMEMNDFLR